MAWLLVDNSNTRTKFTLGDSDGLHTWKAWLPTAEITAEAVQSLVAGVEFHGSLICSVVPQKSLILQEALAAYGPVQVLGATSDLGISIDYPVPSQIGADRLANAVGAGHHYETPCIVIDFGTAVTFDVIEPGPTYCGGVIAPGLGAMQEYLGRRTAMLPEITLAEPLRAIGKSTVDAMLSGAVHGYRGMVKEIILQISGEMSAAPCVIATGGDAALISKGVQEIHKVDPEITLEGLRLVACRIFPKTS
jgi:type III pantothenate kinase